LITYEFPLNEKVRTWLRLEDMFDRVHLYTSRESARDHEVALARLFELLEAGSRADVKSDLLLELDRQRQTLEALKDNPEVSGEALEAAILETKEAASSLHASLGKFGQHLRDNDWLMTIRSRFNIPGGSCAFDLPGLHHWLQQPSYVRQGQLKAWQEPLQTVDCALRSVLRMLRDSGSNYEQIAVKAQFQQMPMARPAQMLRIQLDKDLPCVPELSANKYALNIRFISNIAGIKPTLHEHDVSFLIAYCNL